MGIFVNYPSNIFPGLSNIPKAIVTANTNVLWVTSIIICNRGPAPIRFNLQKMRTQGLTLEKLCNSATTANLGATYSNGITGIGATLTNNGAFVPLSIDGLTSSLSDRVLVKDQTSSFQNGIYSVTRTGSSSVSWLLTRTTDFDTVSKIKAGDAVSVSDGTVNVNTNWIQTSNVVTMGTSPITFITNPTANIYYINELEIAPYKTVDIIDITGPLNMEYSITPYASDKLVCFSNGYTQIFDCEVVYAQLNELPTS